MHSTACVDWERRIVARESLIALKPLFPDEAEAGLSVFKSLRVCDIPGKPTMGDVARPWILEFVASIFGAYDPEAERQIIREFLLLVAKKNAKSCTAAGIMMTALILNPRHSAEFMILAPTKEIADNSFDPAADMADCINDENARAGKSALFRVYRREKRIVHLGTKAELKVIAADSETVGGTKATVVLIDELWLFGKRAGSMSMFREATGGLASRPEGFVVYLSTMSDEIPAGEFKAKLEYGRAVRDGRITDPQFLPVIYEFPAPMLKSGANKLPENFYITNPNLGASVDPANLEREFEKARNSDAAALRDFLAKHLNVEIVQALGSGRWPGAEYWERQADNSVNLESILERCEVVVAGLDGGGLDDLFGMTVLGRERAEIEVDAIEDGRAVRKRIKRWLSWSHAWCHASVLERRKSIATLLQGFADDGDLTIVDDELDDVAQIIEVIQRIKDAGLLYCVSVDPAGLGEMIDALADIDILQENSEHGSNFVVGAPQGYAMMNAIKTAERRLVNGTLVHADQRLMNWAVGNVKIEPTATAIRATKQNAGDAKIDPWMALMDAVTVMMKGPAVLSVYESVGLMFV